MNEIHEYKAVLKVIETEDTEDNILSSLRDIESKTGDLYLKKLMSGISDGIQNQHHKSLKQYIKFTNVIVNTSIYCNSRISNIGEPAFACESEVSFSF
jgi:hypothetical protein